MGTTQLDKPTVERMCNIWQSGGPVTRQLLRLLCDELGVDRAMIGVIMLSGMLPGHNGRYRREVLLGTMYGITEGVVLLGSPPNLRADNIDFALEKGLVGLLERGERERVSLRTLDGADDTKLRITTATEQDRAIHGESCAGLVSYEMLDIHVGTIGLNKHRWAEVQEWLSHWLPT